MQPDAAFGIIFHIVSREIANPFTIFVAILAEASPIVVGISQIVQKMLPNVDNIKKTVKKWTRVRFESDLS